MDAGETPIDLGRLGKPEADAFRHIAQALGATFAGDLLSASSPVGREPALRVASPYLSQRPASGSKPREPALADRPVASVLERMPVAVLVLVGDGVSFMNRAAAALFGYASADVLEATGGIGALFDGSAPTMPGVVNMRTASGAPVAAKVTMAVIDWCDCKAMLFTVVPTDAARPEAAEPRADPVAGDALVSLLDANPDPVAIVTRGGAVEACNAAFRALGGDPAVARLEHRLDPTGLRTVVDALDRCFALAGGIARTADPVAAEDGAALYAVTAGALLNERHACLVFHRIEPAQARRALQEWAPTNGTERATPLFEAVREVRRLVKNAAVLLVSDEDERNGHDQPTPSDGAETQLMRCLLLALAASAPTGAALTVSRRDDGYVVRSSGATAKAVRSTIAADRIAAIARELRLTLRVETTGAVVILASADERA